LRVLGIDPGSRRTGFGVIDAGGTGLRYVASGRVEAEGDDLGRRLQTLYDGLAEVIRRHRPEVAVVEQVFVARNPRSALVLGQARGSVLCAAARAGLPVVEYSPAAVKLAVVGRGRADKLQVQHMVRHLLGLPGSPQADAADALACAICHAHTRPPAARREACAP